MLKRDHSKPRWTPILKKQNSRLFRPHFRKYQAISNWWTDSRAGEYTFCKNHFDTFEVHRNMIFTHNSILHFKHVIHWHTQLFSLFKSHMRLQRLYFFVIQFSKFFSLNCMSVMPIHHDGRTLFAPLTSPFRLEGRVSDRPHCPPCSGSLAKIKAEVVHIL